MSPLLEIWLSVSRLNRVAIDCLLFWLAAGAVFGLCSLGAGAVREMTRPFLALTVLAGSLGALVATLESIRLVRRQLRVAHDEYDLRQRIRRNLRLAVMMTLANSFPAFVLALAWMRGLRVLD